MAFGFSLVMVFCILLELVMENKEQAETRMNLHFLYLRREMTINPDTYFRNQNILKYYYLDLGLTPPPTQQN